MKKKSFLKKHASNILFVVFIGLLLIPQTRKPIQVGVNRLLAFNPSEIAQGDREFLDDYNWMLQSLEGDRKNFDAAKKEVVVLNFWATWCPPCIAEMPSFQELYSDYGDKVSFYFVSSEEAEIIERFLEKKNYQLPVYQPISGVPEQLRSNSLPTTYVISRNGEIVVEKTGVANWNSKGFRELLDELTSQ